MEAGTYRYASLAPIPIAYNRLQGSIYHSIKIHKNRFSGFGVNAKQTDARQKKNCTETDTTHSADENVQL